jgi:hypothetical protein
MKAMSCYTTGSLLGWHGCVMMFEISNPGFTIESNTCSKTLNLCQKSTGSDATAGPGLARGGCALSVWATCMQLEPAICTHLLHSRASTRHVSLLLLRVKRSCIASSACEPAASLCDVHAAYEPELLCVQVPIGVCLRQQAATLCAA